MIKYGKKDKKNIRILGKGGSKEGKKNIKKS